MNSKPTLSIRECQAWRPGLKGLTDADILAWYHAIIPGLRQDAVVVEVGTWRCRSLLFAAELLAATGRTEARIWGIDPYRYPPVAGDMECCDISYRTALQGLLRYGSEQEIGHICLVRATSEAACRLFDSLWVDLVMIDGNHTAEAVAADIDRWSEVIRPGGLLSGHDYAPAWPGVVEAVDAAFGGEHQVHGTVWAMQL
jgi:hypothetical protein